MGLLNRLLLFSGYSDESLKSFYHRHEQKLLSLRRQLAERREIEDGTAADLQAAGLPNLARAFELTEGFLEKEIARHEGYQRDLEKIAARRGIDLTDFDYEAHLVAGGYKPVRDEHGHIVGTVDAPSHERPTLAALDEAPATPAANVEPSQLGVER